MNVAIVLMKELAEYLDLNVDMGGAKEVKEVRSKT